ncbi:MAG: penicillin-binding transpeptidase domain-containing protein [Anaerolineales bacterium]
MFRKLVSAIFVFGVLLNACTFIEVGGEGDLPDPVVTTVPPPNPDLTVQVFLEAWEAGEYATMYSLLSPQTQASISLEDFSGRYQEIMRGGRFTAVRGEIVSSLISNPYQAEVRYRVILTSSIVGDVVREINISLVRQNGQDWGLEWSDAAIMPELAPENGLTVAPLRPTRGNIYDANGEVFVTEGLQAVSMYLVPNTIGGEEAEDVMLSTVRRLFGLAAVDPIVARYEFIRDTNFFVPLGTVPYDDYVGIEGIPGVTVSLPYLTRYYYGDGLTPLDGGAAPHAIGYVSQIQEDELDEMRSLGYLGDEYVGRVGLEARFEDQLRGEYGGSLFLTDANGEITGGELAGRNAGLPYSVYTTLDRNLQNWAQNALLGFRGAVVVMERDTGRVLALASSPGFDPNIFDPQNYNNIGRSEIQQILNEAGQPFINRATGSTYPAGSVFKMITMAAALESGLFDTEEIYYCDLLFTEHGGTPLEDWRYDKERPPAGNLDIIGGLDHSCNPWFYRIGLHLFREGHQSDITDMALAFGFGSPTGIELNEADTMQVPGPDNAQETLGQAWNENDMMQLAIGQSALAVTPLQVARYVAAIGNGGRLLQPYIVDRVENAEGEVYFQGETVVQSEVPVSPETMAAIQEGMVNVIREPDATAYRRFLGLNINLAGKTGTATSGEGTEPHAWFAGYSFEEREDLPDIVVVALVENIGEGSDWAAPIFRRMMEVYFYGSPRQPYPWEERIGVPAPEEDEEAEPTPTPEAQ